MTPDEKITVQLPARLWALVDGQMDNTGQNALDDLDNETADRAGAIREAGWSQVPWVDGEWPPMDQTITIALTRAQWEFAVEEVRASIPIYEEIAQERDEPEYQESVDLGRKAIEVIEPQLR